MFEQGLASGKSNCNHRHFHRPLVGYHDAVPNVISPFRKCEAFRRTTSEPVFRVCIRHQQGFYE